MPNSGITFGSYRVSSLHKSKKITNRKSKSKKHAQAQESTMSADDSEPAEADSDEDGDWQFPDRPEYRPYLLHLMSFIDNRLDNRYPKDTTFSKERLLSIQPRQIRRWMNLRAYGTVNPGEDDIVTGCRSSSLLKAKQAISWYMPNKHVAWIDGHGGNVSCGNPTRHRSISELIKKVKKKECRGQGVKANDKRAYSKEEFYKVLELFRDESDWDHQYKYPMMALWAYHLIHRLDDTCHFQVDAPHSCFEFPFAIYTKTKWSKNVESELQCPDQILFGSYDWKTCPLLWLSVYLDGWLKRHPNAKYMFTDNDDKETGPANINKRYANRVKAVCWKNPDFKALNDQTGPDEKGLGTHSNRKWATTRASRKGARKEQVEIRGRWIGDMNSHIVSKHYISPEDYYSDAFVASLLCEGGPVKYMLRPEAEQVTGVWLYDHIVPNLLRRFARDHRFLMVMALAKLWAAFDDQACEELPLNEVGRIREEFNQAYGAIEGGNPVTKVRLQVLNVDGRLQVVAASANVNNDNGEGDGNGEGEQQQQEAQHHTNNRDAMALSNHHHQEVLQRLDMLQAEQQAMRGWMQQMFDRVITNQRRYGGTVHSSFARGNRQEQQRRDLQQQRAAADDNNDGNNNNAAVRPARADGPGAQGPPGRARPARPVAGDRHARLVARPRCLYELWQEYQFGIGNNKPAKNFTTVERNSRDEGLKQKYHYRNKVWKLQSYMLNAGWTVEGMNAEITRVYNSSHITAIIKGITADSKNPQNPMAPSVGFRINRRFFAGVVR
jgi:hypothetical protein